MAGIKISQLPKWSISDVEQIDASEILIPVSVDTVTGCLRANTLVNLLKNAPSDIDARQNANISALFETVSYLSTSLENFIIDMNRKYNELLDNQNNIDAVQTSQINTNTTDIDEIINVNNQQSAQINALSEWEIANGENQQG